MGIHNAARTIDEKIQESNCSGATQQLPTQHQKCSGPTIQAIEPPLSENLLVEGDHGVHG